MTIELIKNIPQSITRYTVKHSNIQAYDNGYHICNDRGIFYAKIVGEKLWKQVDNRLRNNYIVDSTELDIYNLHIFMEEVT